LNVIHLETEQAVEHTKLLPCYASHRWEYIGSNWKPHPTTGTDHLLLLDETPQRVSSNRFIVDDDDGGEPCATG
jgi:hypothetical protein